ncbi:MAG: hypothetical protein ACRDA3_10885 [Peptostreptococcaceae bacterium]
MFEVEIKNVQGDAYKEFIDLVSSFSSKFLFVEREDMDSNVNLKKVLRKLENSLIEMRIQSEWPTTMLGEGAVAKVYYYKIDNNSKNVLKEESDSLFAWEQPNLPEDLCFLKDDKAWISSCSHEGYCNIVSSYNNIIESILNINGVERSTHY